MNTIPLLLTLFSALLWGISPVITKSLLLKFNRYTIMLLFPAVYLLCLLCAFPYYGKDVMQDIVRLNQQDVCFILFQSVGVLFVGNIIYYYVLKDNKSSLITAIESCAPFFTLIIAYYFLNEKINFIGLIGIILIILGIICISCNDKKMTIFETFINRD
jgi:uncharacterized membrane protein